VEITIEMNAEHCITDDLMTISRIDVPAHFSFTYRLTAVRTGTAAHGGIRCIVPGREDYSAPHAGGKITISDEAS
jgi:hypothetical protein